MMTINKVVQTKQQMPSIISNTKSCTTLPPCIFAFAISNSFHTIASTPVVKITSNDDGCVCCLQRIKVYPEVIGLVVAYFLTVLVVVKIQRDPFRP